MALDDALTADEVAALLRVSRNTVYNLVKRDQLASYHVGRKMRFTRADVENYIARTTTDVAPAGSAPEKAAPAHAPAAAASRPPIMPVGTRDPAAFVIAGNDVIGDVLANYLGSMGNTVDRRYLDSYAALTGLYLGETDAALTHLYDGATGSYNVAYVRRLVPGTPVCMVRLADRQQGLIVRRGNPKGIRGWRDLLRPDVRIVNRELGSGSRVLLDEELCALGADAPEQVAGYADVATSGLSMASYVERGAADAGVGAERVARQVEGVDFVPMRREQLDAVLSMRRSARAVSETLARLVRTRALREEVSAITGYDVSEMGRVLLER